MPGQAVIVGVGSIDYPAEFEGSDRRNLSSMGVSKVVTVTSTYDHRIIQGAESGLFLKRVHELLLGEHDFYEDVFQALDMPYEAVKWLPDTFAIDREEAMLAKQMAVAKLIRVYRVRGHLMADLDPLRWKEPLTPRELDPATYGLTIWDLDREFLTDGVGGVDKLRLGDLLGVLRDAYCRTIGVEYMHIQNTDEQRWIQEQFEARQPEVSKDRKHRILERLNAAESFEKFLATKYVGTKRFGIEGAESAIPILDAVLSHAADAEFDGAVLGMAHRGRLNVLSNIMGKSYAAIFSEFEGHIDPSSVQGSGDVKYHLGIKGKYVSPSGADVAIELAANPSHLETVGPIVMGMTRALQDQIEPAGAFSVLPVLIHGDAAFAGQGIVAESLAMSDIGGYRIGGTIHLIINNQIGFTTAPQYARSSLYCSDVAKTVQAPIFHVNGDDPEACVRVADLALGVPPAVPQGRRDRHGVLPAPRSQRRRRPELHPAADVQGDLRSSQRAQAVRRVARAAWRHHRRRGRGRVERLPRQAAGRARRDPLAGAGDDHRCRGRHGRWVCCRTSRPASSGPCSTGSSRSSPSIRKDSRSIPKLGRQFEGRAKLYADGEVDWATAEALAIGLARDRRAPGPARRSGLSSRHVQPASRRADRLRDRRRVDPARRPRHRRPLLGVRLAAVRVRRARLRVRLQPRQPQRARACGRRSSATSSTAHRS